MSAIYQLIGRVVVWFVWTRYGRQIKVGAALLVASVLLGGYLAASRKVEEG